MTPERKIRQSSTAVLQNDLLDISQMFKYTWRSAHSHRSSMNALSPCPIPGIEEITLFTFPVHCLRDVTLASILCPFRIRTNGSLVNDTFCIRQRDTL